MSEETVWRPLSVRESGDSTGYDGPFEGIPTWLRSSLWTWAQGWLQGDGELQQVERRMRGRLRLDPRYDSRIEIQNMALTGDEQFLDVVDMLAQRIATQEARALEELEELSTILREAGSIWTVLHDDEGAALVRRLDGTMQAISEEELNVGGRAAEHLARGWRAVYGRSPNPTEGYSRAIKAVEAATIPVVSPNNALATLGTVIGELRAQPGRWQVRLAHRDPDTQVRTIADLMDLIWKGQQDRHGSPTGPVSISQEEAEDSLGLAVVVVHYFRTGAINCA